MSGTTRLAVLLVVALGLAGFYGFNHRHSRGLSLPSLGLNEVPVTYDGSRHVLYGLSITNMDENPMSLKYWIRVEALGPNERFRTAYTAVSEVAAVERCPSAELQGKADPPNVIIPAHGVLNVQPWARWTCGESQCAVTCDRTFDEGPGTYRYVVTSLPGNQQIVSAPFTLDFER